MLKILHSSDWHIGKSLYARGRLDEFAAVLDWLAGLVERLEIDIVLVAGDIFDTATPGTKAQELYYAFLHRVTRDSRCRVVVTAGNHDSPSFLSAPEALLAPLGVYARGHARAPEDDVLLLRDRDGAPQAVVCAIPYLRDRDLRRAEAGESPEDKERKLLDGLAAHYAAAAARAEALRAEAGGCVPVIGMGHLFTQGGRVREGEAVRDLYVGALGHVPAALFPESLDYLALGHLHGAQKVAGRETMRYSGSPLPLSFSEAGQEKSVCLLECEGRDLTVSTLPVPVFRRLHSLKGNLESLIGQIAALRDERGNVGREEGEEAWLELVYDGGEVIPDLRGRLEEETAGAGGLEILCVRNLNSALYGLEQEYAGETLNDLDREDVFLRRLAAGNIEGETREELLGMYREVAASLDARDDQEGER